MIRLIIDWLTCLISGHCPKVFNYEGDPYRICLRCGHIETIEEFTPEDLPWITEPD